jgi:hypothetical protein
MTTAAATADFEALLALEGVDPASPLGGVARSIYQQESGSGRNARAAVPNSLGIVGPMQMSSDTFARMADKGWSINDPAHNARAGIRYLKTLDQRGGGDPWLTAAGYVGGEGGLDAAKRGQARYHSGEFKNFPSTFHYADQVVGRMNGWGKERGGAARLTAGNSPTVFRSDRDGSFPPSPASGSPSAAAKPLQANTLLAQLSNLGPNAHTAGATAPPSDAPDPIDPIDPSDPADWSQVMGWGKATADPWIESPGFRPVSLLPRKGQRDFLLALGAYA